MGRTETGFIVAGSVLAFTVALWRADGKPLRAADPPLIPKLRRHPSPLAESRALPMPEPIALRASTNTANNGHFAGNPPTCH
jgi:hypothetical protein